MKRVQRNDKTFSRRVLKIFSSSSFCSSSLLFWTTTVWRDYGWNEKWFQAVSFYGRLTTHRWNEKWFQAACPFTFSFFFFSSFLNDSLMTVEMILGCPHFISWRGFCAPVLIPTDPRYKLHARVRVEKVYIKPRHAGNERSAFKTHDDIVLSPSTEGYASLEQYVLLMILWSIQKTHLISLFFDFFSRSKKKKFTSKRTTTSFFLNFIFTSWWSTHSLEYYRITPRVPHDRAHYCVRHHRTWQSIWTCDKVITVCVRNKVARIKLEENFTREISSHPFWRDWKTQKPILEAGRRSERCFY